MSISSIAISAAVTAYARIEIKKLKIKYLVTVKKQEKKCLLKH